MSLSALIALGLVGIYLMYRGHRGEAALRDVDATTLRELTDAGSDLSQPHEVEFYLYFAHQQTARSVGESLSGEGFAVTVERSEQGSDWLCLATLAMVPTLPELHALRRRFTALAEGHGGAYDGWGATVVEREGTA